MIDASFTYFSYQYARIMRDQDRAEEITKLCRLIDTLEDAGRPDLVTESMQRSLDNLTCAHGTCGHYTCTEGQALADWERFEIQAGRIQ